MSIKNLTTPNSKRFLDAFVNDLDVQGTFSNGGTSDVTDLDITGTVSGSVDTLNVTNTTPTPGAELSAVANISCYAQKINNIVHADLFFTATTTATAGNFTIPRAQFPFPKTSALSLNERASGSGSGVNSAGTIEGHVSGRCNVAGDEIVCVIDTALGASTLSQYFFHFSYTTD